MIPLVFYWVFYCSEILKYSPTFVRLMPDDALQVDTGAGLTGPQTGRIALQSSWDSSILGVGAYWPSPHRQLLGVRGRQGLRGERGGRGQRRSRGTRVTRSRGSWHREHGVHLEGEEADWIKYFFIFMLIFQLHFHSIYWLSMSTLSTSPWGI